MFRAKQQPIRSKKLRDSAKHVDAVCSNCGMPNPDVDHVVLVFAHWNQPGHFGKGMKGDDCIGAILCNVSNERYAAAEYAHPGGCHGYADSEGRRDYEFWLKAMCQTVRFWFRIGLVRVDG